MSEPTPAAAAPADSSRDAKVSLAIVIATVFIDLLGFGIVLPLLPIYGERFAAHESPLSVGLIIGLLMCSFSAMQFIFAPIWGRVSDRIGRRPVLIVGLAGSVVFYALFGLAAIYESLIGLFIARIGAGIAGATISTAQAYIADVTSLENRARGMALIGAAFGLGFTIGPLFAFISLPGENDRLGPGPGFAAAGLCALALALAIFKLRESLHATSPSAARHSIGWSALSQALRAPSIGPLIGSSFLCILAFACFESTVSVMLENKQGPFRLRLPELCATFAFIGFVSLIGQGFITRRLAKRYSEGVLAPIGAVIEISGFVLMALASGYGSKPMLWTSLAVIVLGFSLVNPTLSSLISRRTDPQQQGSVLGLVQGLGALARILGPLLGLQLFFDARILGRTAPLWLAAGVMVAGLVLLVIGARGGKDYPAVASDSA